jgi:surfeit locus 1 family protein
MPRVLLRPRWLLAHVLVVAICVLFVNLGFWQLRRLEERRIENTVISSRMTAEPLPIEDLLVGAGPDLDSLEYRNAVATGVFDAEKEVLVRSQVHQGMAGWHVITPLTLADGRAILVNRGWVPLEMDSVPVPARPADGRVTVEGWVKLTRERQAGGPVEGEGPLTQIARVDVHRLQDQMSATLLPVYLVADETGASLPIAAARPATTDEGPHLMYAIEWFSFTAISAFGYFFLLRRLVHRSSVLADDGRLGQPVYHRDVDESIQ